LSPAVSQIKRRRRGWLAVVRVVLGSGTPASVPPRVAWAAVIAVAPRTVAQPEAPAWVELQALRWAEPEACPRAQLEAPELTTAAQQAIRVWKTA
jgi:hypothetical protein